MSQIDPMLYLRRRAGTKDEAPMRMGTVVRGFLAALLTFLPAASAVPDDSEAATKPYSSADGRVTIALPAAWTLTAAKDDQAAMSWAGFLPDEAGPVSVNVYHLPGMTSARSQPFLERDVHPPRYGVKGPANPETDVLPHLWMDEPVSGAPTLRHVWMYRVIRRNGFTTHVSCRADAWPLVREQCLRAAVSLTTTIEEWPAPPAGYKRRVRDGVVYYVHPAAGDSDAAVHAVVRGEQQALAKLHGAQRPDPESPMVVVVHAKAADAAALSSEAASAPGGAYFDAATYRLFAVAPSKGDDAGRARLAREARRLAFTNAWAWSGPFWLYCGESGLAWSEELTGKPPPFVPAGFQTPTLHRFDAIAILQSASAQDADEMFAYVAFFLSGPKTYRDAFAAFLKDAATTGDMITAQKTRLLSLDQEKLWEAANAFMKELKLAKPK